jgi:hypothetical protein
VNFKLWLEAVDLKIGQIIDIPASEEDNRSPIKVKIVHIRGDSVWLTQHLQHDDLIGAFKMTRAAVQHFANDLTKKVEVSKKTDDPYISKVINGQAKYLGKGDDGMAFEVGDMIVKVSTTVPFQPTNASVFHRTPAGAARSMLENVRLTEKLRKQGVPGILPTYVRIIGDKAFAVRPKVDIPGKLTKEQLNEVKDTINAFHKAGYSINDQIQVGVYRGKIYHYDLGKMQKGDDWSFKDDMSRFNTLVDKSGVSMIDREWEDAINLVPLMVHGDDNERRNHFRLLNHLKNAIVKEFPEQIKEFEEQLEQARQELNVKPIVLPKKK